jgi:proteasome lid subunit RPN8/RPN11
MTAVERVVIRRSLRPAVIEHARQASPIECCGLLVGDAARVLYAVPSPNLSASASRYRVDDRLHLELRRLLRRLVPAAAVVGAYHSHPSGTAWPSPRDAAESFSRDWLHLIVGLGGARPQVRAFRINEGRVRTVRIVWREGRPAEPLRPRRPRRGRTTR